MDAFYASVEQRDDPNIRKKPVAVGGRPEGRGVVAAASYEARTFAVRSAMSMAKAIHLCPQLVIVRPNFKKYRIISEQVFSLFRTVTPLIEPLSLDEAYLDVTENSWGEQLATPIARRLKKLILETTGLTASAGVAPNKFLAKIASGWKKPDGLTVIANERVEQFLHRLPVDALWGVGPITAKKLRTQGVEKLVDIRKVDMDQLRHVVGSQANWLRLLSFGIDDRPVIPHRATKSASTENTFPQDLVDQEIIQSEIKEMAQRTAAWLENKALFARTVTIKVRYSDFTTITRSQTQFPPTREIDEIAASALRLLERTEVGKRPVRMLGVAVHKLSALNLVNTSTLKSGSLLPLLEH